MTDIDVSVDNKFRVIQERIRALVARWDPGAIVSLVAFGALLVLVGMSVLENNGVDVGAWNDKLGVAARFVEFALAVVGFGGAVVTLRSAEKKKNEADQVAQEVAVLAAEPAPAPTPAPPVPPVIIREPVYQDGTKLIETGVLNDIRILLEKGSTLDALVKAKDKKIDDQDRVLRAILRVINGLPDLSPLQSIGIAAMQAQREIVLQLNSLVSDGASPPGPSQS